MFLNGYPQAHLFFYEKGVKVMDLSSIGTSIGQYIRQGIDFILNVNNLPITIGMVLIFCIVMFVM